jgi:phage shock protein E
MPKASLKTYIMKKIFLFLAFVALSTSFGCAQNKKTATTETEKTEMVQDDTFYVDVRTPAEFAEGSAKGAVNIPLDQVESQLSQFKDKKKIVVFCKSGARSAKAITILENNGISNVTNGGSWQEVNALLTK